MDCPKCDGELESKIHEELTLDRCNSCYGLLIEESMFLKMQDEWMVEKFLDVGSATVGRKYDKIEDIECPVCKIEMTKIEDSEQSHIWMEKCPICFRIFFDAGEFTDLKHKTVSDFFKGLAKGKRYKD